MIWQQSISKLDRVNPPVSIEQGKIFIRSQDAVHCLEATTGKLVWETAIDNVWTAPIPVGNKLFFGGHEGIFSLDALTGKTIWQTEDYFSISGVGQIIVQGDKIYAGHNMFRLSCLDSGTGKIIWTYKLQEGNYQYGPLTVAEGKLFTIYKDYQNETKPELLFCLNADTGVEIWRLAIDVGISFWSSPPAIGSGKLIICGSDTISCYDANSGKLLWSEERKPYPSEGWCPIEAPIIAANTLITCWGGTTGWPCTVYWDLNSGKITKELPIWCRDTVLAYGKLFGLLFRSQNECYLCCYGE